MTAFIAAIALLIGLPGLSAAEPDPGAEGRGPVASRAGAEDPVPVAQSTPASGIGFSCDVVPTLLAGSVALLGAAGSLLLSLDAVDSAEQAGAHAGPGPVTRLRLLPSVRHVRDSRGKTTTAIGIKVRF